MQAYARLIMPLPISGQGDEKSCDEYTLDAYLSAHAVKPPGVPSKWSDRV